MKGRQNSEGCPALYIISKLEEKRIQGEALTIQLVNEFIMG